MIKNIFLLKKIDHDPTLVFILLPLLVVLANALTEGGPITVRYAYPCFGVALIWFAFALDKIKKNKELSHLALIKQSRLSVMPIDSKSWKILNNMGKI